MSPIGITFDVNGMDEVPLQATMVTTTSMIDSAQASSMTLTRTEWEILVMQDARI